MTTSVIIPTKNEITGYVIGMFGGSDLNCSRYNFRINPIYH